MTEQRRGEAVQRAVVDATLTLLAERGYGFGVEDVADRAGVHKTTVYRRWPTKPALVAHAIDVMAEGSVPPPTEADPLAGLATLAVRVAGALRHPGGVRALRAVAAVAGDDDGLVTVAADFFDRRYRLAIDLVVRAQAEGSLRDDVDPVLVWEAMVNPLHVRAITGRPADDATARALVDLVLSGARTRAAIRPGNRGLPA